MIKKYNISCNLSNNNYLSVTNNLEQLANFNLSVTQYPYTSFELLNRHDIYQRTGISTFLGGVLNKQAAILNSADLIKSLAQIVTAAGVICYEDTCALHFKRDKHFILHTTNRIINAEYLVLAGNIRFNEMVLPIDDKTFQVAAYALVTEPLEQFILPSHLAISDKASMAHYYRQTMDNNFIIGARALNPFVSSAQFMSMVNCRVLEIFPQLKNKTIKQIITGIVDVTNSSLPYVGQLQENCYFSRGLSGLGLVQGALLGKIISAAICGDEKDFNLFSSIKHSVIPHALKYAHIKGVKLDYEEYRIADRDVT